MMFSSYGKNLVAIMFSWERDGQTIQHMGPLGLAACLQVTPTGNLLQFFNDHHDGPYVAASTAWRLLVFSPQPLALTTL